LFQSYSSIVPPGYASTREVAHFLVSRLGGRIRTTKRADVLGLAMDERFDQGNYHLRGYLGDDKPDHCAHLGLLKDVVKAHLNRRWNPPRGAAVKTKVEPSKKDGKKAPKRATKENDAGASLIAHGKLDGGKRSQLVGREHNADAPHLWRHERRKREAKKETPPAAGDGGSN
jgi:hypothetical protein